MSDFKKLNGYMVKDATARSGVSTNGENIGLLSGRVTSLENLKEYSTTEKVIGKWIDEADIYQKVIVIEAGDLPDLTESLDDYTTVNINSNVSIDTLVKMDGFIVGDDNPSNDYVKFPLNYSTLTNTSRDISTYYSHVDECIKIRLGKYDWTVFTGFIILEYTKVVVPEV